MINRPWLYLFVCAVLLSSCKGRSRDASSLREEGSGPRKVAPDHLDDFSNGGQDPQVIPEHELHWGYDSQNEIAPGSVLAPAAWGLQYPVCAQGDRQSPIKFTRPLKRQKATSQTRPRVVIAWPNERASFGVLNNRHTVQANADDSNAHPHRVSFRNQTYLLKQFHYHKESEHQIFQQLADGTSIPEKYPLEVHFVHESESEPGKFLVIGVLGTISKNKSSKFTEELARLKDLPDLGEGSEFVARALNINPTLLLPENFLRRTQQGFEYLGDFITYQGSLTTPPCTQAVTWVLLLEPVDVSMNDIVSVQKARFGNEFANARFPSSTPAIVPGPAHKLEYFESM